MKTNRPISRGFTILFAVVLGLGALFTIFTMARSAEAAASAYDCTTASMNVGDCEALVALYESTNGKNWNTKSNWLDDSPCSQSGANWFGVTCLGGRVSELALPENNLVGPLPDELGNLGQLQVLNLFSNTITGTLPTTLMELDTVTFLHLGNNEIEGEIAPEFEQMDGLISLYLNQNRLEGMIPETLDNLIDLQFLYLHGNKLSGPVPDSLCTLNLANLNLGYNGLAIDETSDPCLDQFDPTWRETQTVPPAPRFLHDQAKNSQGYLTLTWDPIPFTAGSGFYEVFMGTESGVYDDAPVARTGTKLDDMVTIEDLTMGQEYFFVVRTQSNVNNINDNIVVSDYSGEISNMPLALTLTDFQASSQPAFLMLIIAAALLPTLLLSAAAIIGYRKKAG